ACARIGAVHSVVFAGFSSDALKNRLIDAGARILITANEGVRGGKHIPLKDIADQAIEELPSLQTCLVVKRTDKKVSMRSGRDKWMHDEVKKHRPYCPPVAMNAEDPLFILYTSGSTGKPKG